MIGYLGIEVGFRMERSVPVPDQSWWLPLWEFVTHIAVGTGMFALIAAPAVGLDFVVRWLSANGVSVFVTLGLTVAEYGLFTVDLALFLVFVGRMTWRAVGRLW